MLYLHTDHRHPRWTWFDENLILKKIINNIQKQIEPREVCIPCGKVSTATIQWVKGNMDAVMQEVTKVKPVVIRVDGGENHEDI